MATTNGIALKKSNLKPASEETTLKGLLGTEQVKNRFEELLGKKSAWVCFISPGSRE